MRPSESFQTASNIESFGVVTLSVCPNRVWVWPSVVKNAVRRGNAAQFLYTRNGAAIVFSQNKNCLVKKMQRIRFFPISRPSENFSDGLKCVSGSVFRPCPGKPEYGGLRPQAAGSTISMVRHSNAVAEVWLIRHMQAGMVWPIVAVLECKGNDLRIARPSGNRVGSVVSVWFGLPAARIRCVVFAVCFAANAAA
ncbi:hypothetical protein AABM17_856 [Neisseria musculi]|uniref:Uncharacterized protein n=1 Tax=Neisseria musculi TaxID=1815583 RepID=A0A7H1MEP9_9NEIS|nr:hypothetical protein H7A79_0856 [Neisseria musculi]